jgi:hypothetical protein
MWIFVILQKQTAMKRGENRGTKVQIRGLTASSIYFMSLSIHIKHLNFIYLLLMEVIYMTLLAGWHLY